jgi:cytidylate kinase
MAVIAMTQEMATMGKDVALGVCEALGLQQVRHEVGDHVAGMMHVKKSLIRRIREGKASRIEKWAADERTISIFTAGEVLELAVKGDVLIRGWGATQILRPVPHIACVRVCSPMGVRVKRLMERLESDDEDLARREIEMDDAARASRIAEHFSVVWGDPTLYDLTINTERMPVATCVDQIVALVKSPAFAQTAASKQLLADLALRAKVRAVLKASPVTQDIDVAIEASAGKITLTGIVVDDRERLACETTVATVAGVTATDNQLKTMSGGMFRFPSQPRHN